MSINEMLLVHGMIIQGKPKGQHYGVAAAGKIDEKVKNECISLGNRVANLVNKLF